MIFWVYPLTGSGRPALRVRYGLSDIPPVVGIAYHPLHFSEFYY